MRKSLFLAVLLCVAASGFTGDLATFLDLGFSLDSDYYMFAQYGIDDDQYNPYAQIYFVDVKNNSFVSGGVNTANFTGPVQLGQTGFGAFLNLYNDVTTMVEKYDIDHLATGRLIYILINGEKPKDELEFRDFENSNKYKVLLIQKSYDVEGKISSSFHLNVFITDSDGNTKSHIVGLPDYKRKDVKQYRIKQIMFSPDESSLVFIIEKELKDLSVRYMVETVKL